MRAQYKSDDVVEQWTLVDCLGTGGNAEVWRATHAERTVALKILFHKNPGSEPYARFRTEIEALRRIGEHPGVLPLVDSSLPERPSKASPAWLAMPLAQPVRDALGKEPPLERVVAAVAAYAATLAELAERHGIYHRDIKPENMYLFMERWCLGDFGLVDYPEKPDLTAPGKIIGPKFYLAPELLASPESAMSGPADVYSLGKALWVLATGQNFPSPGFLPRSVVQFRVSSYNTHQKAFYLDALVEQTSDPDPSRRPDMKSIARELNAWLSLPRATQVPADLTDLRIQIEPVIKSHQFAMQQEQEARARPEKLAEQLKTTLEPLSRAAAQTTGLSTKVERLAELSNIPEADVAFKDPSYVTYSACGFRISSPTRIGQGNNFLDLLCGVVIHSTKSGVTYYTAAYVIAFGAGNYRTVWSDMKRVPSDSAEDVQELSNLLDSLSANLRVGIDAFACELRDRQPA